MQGAFFRNPSPLNMPQSCASIDAFGPNTPSDARFLNMDSAKHFGNRFGRDPPANNMFSMPSPHAMFDLRNIGNKPLASPNGIFTPVRGNQNPPHNN